MSWVLTSFQSGPLLRASTGVTEFAVHWLIQSTLLMVIGLLVARLLSRRGAAAQSVVYRTTLVAVLLCPLSTAALSGFGGFGWSIELPPVYREAVTPITTSADSPTQPLDESVAGHIRRPDAPDFSAVIANRSSGFDRTLTPAQALPNSESQVAPSKSHVLVERVDTQPRSTVGPQLGAAADESDMEVSTLGVLTLLAQCLWLTASTFMLGRLWAAWRSLERLRRQAHAVDEETQQMCLDLGQEIGVSAPELLRSPYFPSPCLAGIWRPAILLPAEDTPVQMRDVLVHELAHLRRRDCHWNLLRRVAEAIFFFQPLLWWLSRRIESSAEEVCDDFVLELGGDGTEYARHLVDVAELSSARIAPVGVGIVSLRSMVSQRVQRIIDPSRSLSTRIGVRLTSALLIGGVCATALVGLVELESAEAELTQDGSIDELPGDPQSTAAARFDDRKTGGDDPVIEADRFRFAGQVLDSTGTSVVEAGVHVVFPHAPESEPTEANPRATTDRDGKFEFTVPSQEFLQRGNPDGPWQWSQIVVHHAAHGVATVDAVALETTGRALQEARRRASKVHRNTTQIEHEIAPLQRPIRFARNDYPILGRLADIDGRAIVNAKVTLISIRTGHHRSLDGWEHEMHEMLSPDRPQDIHRLARVYQREAALRFRAEDVWGTRPVTTSDAEGRFALPVLGDEWLAQLLIESKQHVPTVVHCRSRAGKTITFDAGYGQVVKFYPSTFTHVLEPTRAITGVVRDAETGRPIANARLTSRRLRPGYAGYPTAGSDIAHTSTDQSGTYRLLGLPIAAFNPLVIQGPAKSDYLTTSAYVDSSGSATDPTNRDIRLWRGRLIEGRVVDAETGVGVKGSIQFFPRDRSIQRTVSHTDEFDPHPITIVRFPDQPSVIRGDTSRLNSAQFVSPRGPVQSDSNGSFRVRIPAAEGDLIFIAQDGDYRAIDWKPPNTTPRNLVVHAAFQCQSSGANDNPITLRVHPNAPDPGAPNPNAPDPGAAHTDAARKQDTSPSSASATSAADDIGVQPLQFSGLVLTADGNPKSGARVHLMFPFAYEQTASAVRATTDRNGRFKFTTPRKDYFRRGEEDAPWIWATLAVVADGQGTVWRDAIAFETTGAALEEARRRAKLVGRSFLQIERGIDAQRGPLHLPESMSIEGTVVDIEGQPVPDALLRVTFVGTGANDQLEPWRERMNASTGNREYIASHVTDRELVSHGVSSLFPDVRSGHDGRFSIRSIGAGRVVRVVVMADGYETGQILCRTEDGVKLPVSGYSALATSLSDSRWIHAARLRHVAAPSRPIIGTVRDAETGDPIAGARLSSRRVSASSRGRTWQYPLSADVFRRAVTDQNGRYRLTGLPITRFNSTYIVGPPGSTYVESRTSVDTRGNSQTPVRQDIKLQRGHVVRGQMTDHDSGQGVTGIVRFFGATNMNEIERDYFPIVEKVPTTARGEFALTVPPSVGFLAFTADDIAHPRTAVIPASAKLRPRTSRGEKGLRYNAVRKIDTRGRASSEPIDLQIEMGRSR